MSFHPTLAKKFVSPFLQRPVASPAPPVAGPSNSGNSYATPTRSNPLTSNKKRKIEEYISDSAGEDDSAGEEDDEDLLAPASSARPNATQTDYPDPVARVVGSAGPLGRGSPYSRPTSTPTTLNGGLLPRDGTIRGAPTISEKENLPETYWMVQWRKPQQKKHKTWDGDAVLVVRGGRCFMKDTDGRDIASAAFTGGVLKEGDELRVGGKEVEIDCEIPAQKYLDGSCFGHNPLPIAPPVTLTSRPINLKPLPQALQSPYAISAQQRAAEAQARTEAAGSDLGISGGTSGFQGRKPIAAGSFYGSKGDKIALGVGNQGIRRGTVEPRYNPTAEGAVVMKRPSRDHAAKHNKKNLDIVDVVVHPELGKCLRPHQVEGVKFMYECVMGMRKTEGTGCILADEMGLGKTLQAISLIFTLLQQNPYGGPGAGPVVGKVLVVTPVSLVQNWRKEFHKWLGKQRVGVFIGDGDKQKIRQFANSKGHQVLLIGYEKLRTVVDVIKSSVPPIGLIICDEAHRLKSKDNKTTKMFDALSTKRRILLSGTPLQNDLGEFWAMSDFACPGLLDTYNVFSKVYEKPILKSRAPKCSVKDKELGQARADKLSEITGQFILRRTADILAHYLPPKREYILFIAPTSLQLEIFSALLTPKVLQAFTRGATAQCLALINHLKKICNCPLLLKAKEDMLEGVDDEMKAAMKLIPHGKQDPIPMSGKLKVLDSMLTSLYRNTEEKIVLVSNYTSTLDVLESYCSRKHYKTLRLDGTTAVKTRQDLVDAFNNGSQHQSFVFLLSSKAGGVGLNLIGASRLVLFDSDWNPSTDLQAQARIHRDGQKRTVQIYRFLTTGTIEEKIYQRQITKLGLSDQLMDQAKASKNKETDSFSPEDLRDLFTVQMKTDGCQTHDLLACDCTERQSDPTDDDSDVLPPSDNEDSDIGGPKFVVASQFDERPSKKQRLQDAEAKQAKLAALLKFSHIDPSLPGAAALIQDDILHGMLGVGKRKKGVNVKPASVSSGVTSNPASEIADSAGEEESDVPRNSNAVSKSGKAEPSEEGVLDSTSESGEILKADDLDDDFDDEQLAMFADTIDPPGQQATESMHESAACNLDQPDSDVEIPWDSSPRSAQKGSVDNVKLTSAADKVMDEAVARIFSDDEDLDMNMEDQRGEGLAGFDMFIDPPKRQRKPKAPKSGAKKKKMAKASRVLPESDESAASESDSTDKGKKSKAKPKGEGGGKRKANGKAATEVSLGPAEKRYDLQAIANRGEGGKIMFVFEKVTGSEI